MPLSADDYINATTPWFRRIEDQLKLEQVKPMTTINPDHYRNVIPNIEVIQVTENFNFNRGNAIKYLARAGAKDKATEVEDLKKAAWYCVREVKRLGGHLIAADLGLEG